MQWSYCSMIFPIYFVTVAKCIRVTFPVLRLKRIIEIISGVKDFMYAMWVVDPSSIY